jgi:hypothetical protein
MVFKLKTQEVSKQLESFCSDAGCGRLGTARNPCIKSDPRPLQNSAVSRMKTKVSGIRENQEEPTEVITVIAAVRIGDLA